MLRREVQPPSFQCQPRGQLPTGAHGYVDSILKNLKKCRRQLNPNFVAYCEELQILERLYYKGKNQHSASLVWKRVFEARRYTQRVATSGIIPFVDGLYLSFFDLPWTSSQKLKGSWSHYPATDSVALVSGRLTAISQLLEKCHSRLEEAYRHLTLAMQSGAFVQFLVLFIATVSRIHTLSNTLLSDVCQALSLTDQVISLLRVCIISVAWIRFR
ncbi:hypothetical protein BDZ89DRAFT_288113 [Hymenopellis radicata]|nr:hypothetical protein BDZ89DRAFT_288113 [Hymenopellis radicata]